MQAHPSDLPHLAQDWGIHLTGVSNFYTPEMRSDVRIAMDAQPVAITQANAAIPAWFTTMIDPQVIRVALAPMKATDILGSEQKKGDWLQTYIQFPMLEQTGEAVAYGDWQNAGVSNVNMNWVPRQQFVYQTITRWGEREVGMAGLGGINYKNELDLSSINTLNRFQNASYFNGISGLLNYGLLNAPGLAAALTPSTKAAGGTTWVNATANEVFDDVKKMVIQMMTQTKGLVTSRDSFTLALSPNREGYLANTNSFGLTAWQMIKQSYPNMRVVSAIEYDTVGGQLAQLWVNSLDGQDTGYTAFGEKLRAHAVVVELSAWLQKKSQSTWGAIIKQPLACVQMLGI